MVLCSQPFVKAWHKIICVLIVLCFFNNSNLVSYYDDIFIYNGAIMAL